MARMKQIKKDLRHREWAEEIAECRSSCMQIKEWCRMKGISCSTYYRRLRIVREEFLEQSEEMQPKIVPLSIVNECCEAPAHTDLPIITENLSEQRNEKIFIRKNSIEIELPQSTEEHTLFAVLKGLQQC